MTILHRCGLKPDHAGRWDAPTARLADNAQGGQRGAHCGWHDANVKGVAVPDGAGIESLSTGRLLFASLGTFTSASPSSTTSPSTAQMQNNRARDFSGISSATVTVTTTVSPIFTGARKFKVCEM